MPAVEINIPASPSKQFFKWLLKTEHCKNCGVKNSCTYSCNYAKDMHSAFLFGCNLNNSKGENYGNNEKS